MASPIRQNYHEECEAGVNKQIYGELCAMYTYLSMSAYCGRDDVALSGFVGFFQELAMDELEHAEDFMKFQNQRGGKIILRDITKPKKDEWGTALEMMQEALEVEKMENRFLLELVKVASKHNDSEMVDFVQNHCLHGSVKIIKKIGDHITNLKRVGEGHGEWHFDHELQD